MTNSDFTIRQAQPPISISFFSDDRTEIARVEHDGTVRLYREGADSEAARIFWGSLQFHGKILYTQIANLVEVCRRYHVPEDVISACLPNAKITGPGETK